jgi:hypothetical protein
MWVEDEGAALLVQARAAGFLGGVLVPAQEIAELALTHQLERAIPTRVHASRQGLHVNVMTRSAHCSYSSV